MEALRELSTAFHKGLKYWYGYGKDITFRWSHLLERFYFMLVDSVRPEGGSSAIIRISLLKSVRYIALCSLLASIQTCIDILGGSHSTHALTQN